METMLADGKVAEKLEALKKKDKGLWEKIRDFFKDFVKKLKAVAKYYDGVSPDSAEGRFVASLNKDVIEKLQDLFAEGLNNASENRAAVNAVEKNRLSYPNAADAGAFSIRRTQEMTWEEQIEKYLSRSGEIKTSDTLVLTGFHSHAGVENSLPFAVPLSVLAKAQSGKDSYHTLKNSTLKYLQTGLNSWEVAILNPERNSAVYTFSKSADSVPILVSFELGAEFDGDVVNKATSIHFQKNLKAMLENLPAEAKVCIKKELAVPGTPLNLGGLNTNAKLFIDDYTSPVTDSQAKNSSSDEKILYSLRDEGAEVGININDSRQEFTRQILDGEKTVETRNTDSLSPYVGQRVGLVRTGRGRAELVGYAVIGEPKVYRSAEEFEADYARTRVHSDDGKYGFRNGVKYGYPLSEVERIEPRTVTERGIVARDVAAEHQRLGNTEAETRYSSLGEGVKLSSRGMVETQDRLTSEYQAEADRILNMQDTSPRQLIVGYTPDVYQRLGMPSLPLTIGSGHVYSSAKTEAEARQDGNFRKGVHYHGLGGDAVKNIYDAVKDPVMVIAAKDVNPNASPMRSTHSVVAIIDIGTAPNSMLIPIEITAERTVNGKRMDVNTISSVYDRPVGGLITEAIALENSGDVGIFYAKKEASALVSAGVSFPIQMQQSMASDGILHHLAEKVNMKIKKNVQSQQFTRWFGDWQNDPENASKVVNEDGTPKVVYHGTDKEFREFRIGDIGYHVGERAQAEERISDTENGHVIPLYASIRNPLHTAFDFGDWHGNNVAEMLVETEQFEDSDSREAIEDRLSEITGMERDESDRALREYLQSLGYDGIVYDNQFEGEGESWIAFESSQLKHTEDNIGTYDGSTGDFYLSSRTRLSKEEADAAVEALENLGRNNVGRSYSLENSRKTEAWADKRFKAESKYSSLGEGVRLSGRIDSADTDDVQSEYGGRKLGWAIEAGILSKSDQAAFYEKVAEIRAQNYKSARRVRGGYAIDLGSKLLFTDADWKLPSLDAVWVLNDNSETMMEIVKEEIIDAYVQSGRYDAAREAVQAAFGQDYAALHIHEGDSSYERKAERGEGANRGRGNPRMGENQVTSHLTGNETSTSVDDGVLFSARTAPDPEKTIPVYKLMRLKDGMLYPLFIDSANATEIGRWYDADSPDLSFLKRIPAGVFLVDTATGQYESLHDYCVRVGDKSPNRKNPTPEMINDATVNGMRWMSIVDKSGEKGEASSKRRYGESRSYYNLGINGSGDVNVYALRPGWHAGSLPTMRQIGKGKNKDLRDDSFVWVKGRVSADIDYRAEAESNPDKDIPTHIPVNGYYLKATNANAVKSQADVVGWYVAGAFIADEIISDSEARAAITEWNAAHPDAQVEYDYERESGMDFDAKQMKLVPKEGTLGKGVKLSARESYSYDVLTKKPPMEVTVLDTNVPSNRADIVKEAKRKAALIGKTDKNGTVSVYVGDIGTDVVIGTDGLKHGLTRKPGYNALAVMNIGSILKSSIEVNLLPARAGDSGGRVLVGMGLNSSGNAVCVRSIINTFTSELQSVDVLYAVNAKGTAAHAFPHSPRFANNSLSELSPKISIADLLKEVNAHFPQVLSEDVLKRFGHETRPAGDLGDSVLYSSRTRLSKEEADAAVEASRQAQLNEIRARQELAEMENKLVDTIIEYEQEIKRINKAHDKLVESKDRARMNDIGASKSA